MIAALHPVANDKLERLLRAGWTLRVKLRAGDSGTSYGRLWFVARMKRRSRFVEYEIKKVFGEGATVADAVEQAVLQV